MRIVRAHPSGEPRLDTRNRFRTLEEVLTFLAQRADYESRNPGPAEQAFDLGRVARLADAVGGPQRSYRCVHVAGTKGKGSTSRLLAALLTASGLRVGLYTSPHVEHFMDRIVVDGTPISAAAFVGAMNVVQRHLERRHTYFEILTIASFLAFREAEVDCAVVEVGIGGRLDATNVVLPEVGVITNIDFDHVEVLGNTLEEIAREKAGIIKSRTPVVCGPVTPEPARVVAERARACASPLILYGSDYSVETWLREDWRGRCAIRVGARLWEKVVLNCPARFMAENAAHAFAAYAVLEDKGLVRAPPPNVLREALARTVLPACCEVFPRSPLIVIDGAHNTMSAENLAKTLGEIQLGSRLVLVIGVPRDKDLPKMLDCYAQLKPSNVIVTPYQSLRSTSPEKLVEIWRNVSDRPAVIAEAPKDAFARAVQYAGPDGAVIVTGSLYLAGMVRPLARNSSLFDFRSWAGLAP